MEKIEKEMEQIPTIFKKLDEIIVNESQETQETFRMLI